MHDSLKSSQTYLILGGLWGALVGDALGVPVEFQSRADVQSNPVTGMRGHGTHDQPAGTWSDDGALMLCTVDSLLDRPFDPDDMGAKFVDWYHEGLWTARGHVFDIGIATSKALSRIASGTRAELAGSDGQYDNGNGSLMRILPVALRFAGTPTPELLDRIHRASAITHGHPRSQMACGCYSLVVRRLLAGARPADAVEQALREFRDFYEANSVWAPELKHFQLLLGGDLPTRPESEIDSSGYVVHTLVASLWCLLTTDDYRQCVLKAVNLGGDTDTTGCVAGGLAGVAYGLDVIPSDWIRQLPRQADLQSLLRRFSQLGS